jgi:hypothetical protein
VTTPAANTDAAAMLRKDDFLIDMNLFCDFSAVPVLSIFRVVQPFCA